MKHSQTLTANGLMTGEAGPVKWRLPGVVTLSILLHAALIAGLLREERVPPLLMAGSAGGAVAFSVLSASQGQPAAPAAAQPAVATATAVTPSAAQPPVSAAGESARPLATEVTLPDPEIALPHAPPAAREAGLKAAAPPRENSQPVARQQAAGSGHRTPRRGESQASPAKPARQPQSTRRTDAVTAPAAARQAPPAVTPSATAQANAATGGQTAAASGSARQAASSALNNGSSDSGSAVKGAGSSNNQNFRAKQRRVEYPQRAKALGVEGRVRIKFDVTASGTVTNVRVMSETPPGVFARSVIKDAARWRYETQTAVNDQVTSVVFKLNSPVALEN